MTCRPSITLRLKKAKNNSREERNEYEVHRVSGAQQSEVTHVGKQTCKYCPKKLAASSISRHMKGSHNSSQRFKCNICQKKFQTNTKLEEHYTNKHVANIISMHQCSSCEYSTMNKYYLKQHISHWWRSRLKNTYCSSSICCC